MPWDPALSALARCSTVFFSADPARAGRVAFWAPDGEPLPEPLGIGTVEEVDVVADDALPRRVTALRLSVRDALPLLVRTGAGSVADPSRSCAFWGAAALLALHLVA
ncbi:ATP-dependent helicase, partial [Streptomyces sp. Act-28]